MRKTKLRSRVVAMMLSLLTVLSVVPSVSMTASAATTIPVITESTPLANNPYMQALFAVGFDKSGWGREKSNNGTYKMFDYSLWKDFKSNVWTNKKGILYNLTSPADGLDPKVASSTTSESLIKGFNNKGGLCCASFVSYVIFNYLPNKGYDISRYGKASEISFLNDVNSWNTYLRSKSGVKVTDVPRITGVSNNDDLKAKIQKINLRDKYGAKIGDIVIFGGKDEDGSFDPTDHIAIYAGRYKSSSGTDYDWVIDLGTDAGPRLTPTVAMYKNNSIMQPTATIPAKQFGGISVKKVDKEDTEKGLEGAKFAIFNSNNVKVKELTTDVNGCATTGKVLKPGTYTVKETQAPPNYELSNETQTVTVVADKITECECDFVNEKKKGGISVKKVDKEDTEKGLEGAKFAILNSNNVKVKELTTDVNGCATTGKVLKPGTYTVKETQAPPNYELSNETQTVTVVADTITPCEYDFVNEKQEGTLRFTKIVDANTTMTQDETFSFKIYKGDKATGTPVQSFKATISATDKMLSKINGLSGLVKEVEENGVRFRCFELTLDVGTYTVKEVLTDAQLQAGYIKQSAQTIKVTKDTTATVSFKNKAVLNSIIINKTADELEKGEYKDKFNFAILKYKSEKNLTLEKDDSYFFGKTNADGTVEFAGAYTAKDVIDGAANNDKYKFRIVEFKEDNDYILPTECSYVVGSSVNKTVVNMTSSTEISNINSIIGRDIPNNGKGWVVSDEIELTLVATNNSLTFSIHNTLQKGKINIHKTGEVFTGVTETETINGLTLKQLKFEEKNLKDVKFKITAAENIIVNSNIVHNAGDYITTVTTDANGEATIDNLFLGKYTITEVYTPDGHITAEPQTVTLTATDNTTEVFEKNVDFYNDKVDAAVSVTKVMKEININGVTHGNKNEIQNVVFGLYADEDINSYTGQNLISKNDLIDVQLVSTDNKTFKFTADLPIGKYYIKEIKTDNNYVIDNTQYTFEFSPTDNTTKTIKIDLGTIINTPKGDIVGVKKDLYGKVIAGAKFKLYAQNTIYDENLGIKYRANDQIGEEVTSDANGKFSWSGLYYGSYYIKETYTPTPYVLPIEAVASDIYINIEDTVQTVNVFNTHKVGQIKIIKTANQFTGVTSTTSDGKTVYTPTYTTKGLAGVKFDIYAAEDIYLNGNKIVDNGYKIQSDLVTDANGEVTSIELLLGKYRIVETYAPGGYVKSADQYVEVKNDTNARVATTTKTIFNERATAQAEVVKIMQFVEKHGIIHGNKGEIKNVTLGLFANETITATNGQSIPKDGLIEMQKVDVTTNTETFNFTKDIPFGSYYIQEIATDGAYFLNGVKREFTFKPTSDNTQKNNKFTLESITNYAKGDIVGVKKNKEGQLVEGCKFKLYDSQGNQVQNEVTSDKNGKFGWSGLDYGTYYIKETYVPDGYILPTLAIKTNINISQTNTIGYAEVTNQKTKVEFLKTDEKGKPLANAEFALYKGKTATGTPITTWTSTTSAKVFEGLAKGDYTIKETKAPDGYILLKELVHFTVDNNITQDNPLEVSAANKPTRVEFLKTDENGKPLANAEFALYKVENGTDKLITTWISTTDAKVFERLTHGEYYIVETKSPAGFALLPGVIKFTVDDEDKVIEVSAMDDKLAEVFSGGPGTKMFGIIGNSAIGLFALVITTVAIKSKRNKREED